MSIIMVKTVFEAMGLEESIEGEHRDEEKKIRMKPWGTSISRTRYARRRQSGSLEGTAIEEENQVSVVFQKPTGNKNVPS